MSEFDEWFKESYPTQYAFKDSTPTCKSFYDGAKLGAQSQQAKIDELKMSNHHLSVQLVDSNAHYDHVKKERDELQAKYDELNNRATGVALDQMATAKLNYELQGRIDDLEQNKICIRNILEKLDTAESKLNKIAIQAQKKLETFGSALRFKDAVQDILKGNKDEN